MPMIQPVNKSMGVKKIKPGDCILKTSPGKKLTLPEGSVNRKEL
jgi:hypothetical protein